MATDADVQAAGFRLPKGTDLISGGDDAIRANAHAAHGQRWWRGTLTSTDVVNQLTPGAYAVPSGAVASALGLPAAFAASLLVVPINTIGAQTYLLTTFSTPLQTWQAHQGSNRVMSAWTRIDGAESVLDSSSDLDTLLTGAYIVTNNINATALELPEDRLGTLSHVRVNATAATQLYHVMAAGNTSRLYARYRLAGTWTEWEQIGAPPASSSAGAGHGHELARQALTARKGGRIGTGDRGVVALRFDDAPAEFVEKVLPLLEARRLPFTRVTTSERIHDVPLPAGTFEDMQEYSIQFGGEVWNHGKTHGEASGTALLEGEITGALDTLRTAMPRLVIDCFAPPGGSISWDGYMPSNTAANYATPAGAALLEAHALVTGYYQDSYYWPIDGIMRDGQNHYGNDSRSVANTKGLIDWARDWRVGVVMMWHANNLDTTGRMSTAGLAEVLDYLVAERDAGNVLVLTVSGLAAADRSSDQRDDILTVHAGATISESIPYPQFRRGILGSTRELLATVTGTSGQTVTSVIGESTRTHTIPASGTLALRHVATIPTDITSLTVSIDAETTGARLLPV